MFEKREKKALIVLGSLYVLRMLGLFMLMPALPLATQTVALPHKMLIGLAIGIYGFIQALLQIPFGLCSDYFGRYRLICFGLILFMLGSLVGFFGESLYSVILARALQGACAIGCVLLALVSDFTRDSVRACAMSCIGLSIGGAFLVAFGLGPTLQAQLGIQGIFGVCFLLGLLAFGVFIRQRSFFLSAESEHRLERKSLVVFITLLGPLWFLYFGVFALHAILSAVFLIIPEFFLAQGFVKSDLGRLYGSAIFTSLLFLFPLLRRAQSTPAHKLNLILAGIGLLLSALLLALCQNIPGVFLLCVFFVGFNVLEALLPSLVSSLSDPSYKGTALAFYTTFQFFGIFMGAALGGCLNQAYDKVAVLAFSVILAVIWFVWVLTIKMRSRQLCQKA